ncbi:DUF3027 domain-containing protein [Pengzhenrongella frigida]|uniref:DUF3027 domain-containing protein n=1 Tax=Pengzhenrongella frigida TaxID=1259133 RepID=A0A4Q5MZU4_9MICO|nr:DUF3027 domain-containing protein [Cellulomonas sp. HLT2-17]RYV51265.1 DUF3027 domain-containing protein [Cellulomonas sp. HLT2-17]
MATPTKDAVLTNAVELARQVAIDAAEWPEHVGEHLGVVVEGDRLVSHQFASTAPGYRGWRWTVTLARVPRARVATICEVELLPGDAAILAPAWLPWSERLRPGDIGPGDVLPFMPDDPRLEPGYVATGDDEQDRVAFEELALARVRVLAPEGRERAAERWYTGSQGPTSPGSLVASAACQTCAFLVPLSGSLGLLFGVCANEWSPDDGKVVSLDHGCGAHSETDIEPHASDWPDPVAKIDDLDLELVSLVKEQPAAIRDESVVDLDAEPVVEPVVDVVAEPVIEPAVDAVAEPVIEPAVDAVAEPVIEPAVDANADLVVEPVVEPVADPAEPVAETEPVADLAPVVDPTETDKTPAPPES